MRIAITDACIFIDLHFLELISPFFELDVEVHTSRDIINELHAHQKEIFSAYQNVGKLTVHTITEKDRRIVYNTYYPKSLSDNDKSAIHLARQIEAIIVSSDKAVRHYAKTLAIEYHGMLWILDQLEEKTILSKRVAAEKLKKLISSYLIYQSNADLLQEMQKRLQKWKSQ